MTALVAILALLVIGVEQVRARRRTRPLRHRIRQLRGEVQRLQADLKHAEADRDAFSEELDHAHLALATWTAERTGECRRAAATLRIADTFGRSFDQANREVRELRLHLGASIQREVAMRMRSFKRHAALVRVARYCRAQDEKLRAAIGAGLKFGGEVVDREREIESLNARIAELDPAAAGRASSCAVLDRFFDGELDVTQAATFRDHLARCERCGRILEGRMQEAIALRAAVADCAASPGACAELVAFVHGELSNERAAAFRDHLPRCGTCRAGLVEAAELAARLSTLPPTKDPT